MWVKSPQITLSFWKGQTNLESDWPTFRYSLLSCSAASFSVSAARLTAALFFVQINSCWSQNYLSPTKKAPCFSLKSTSCCIAQHVVASLSRHNWSWSWNFFSDQLKLSAMRGYWGWLTCTCLCGTYSCHWIEFNLESVFASAPPPWE